MLIYLQGLPPVSLSNCGEPASWRREGDPALFSVLTEDPWSCAELSLDRRSCTELNIINIKGCQNGIIGSKRTAILWEGWILPFGGVALGRVYDCLFLPLSLVFSEDHWFGTEHVLMEDILYPAQNWLDRWIWTMHRPQSRQMIPEPNKIESLLRFFSLHRNEFWEDFSYTKLSLEREILILHCIESWQRILGPAIICVLTENYWFHTEPSLDRGLFILHLKGAGVCLTKL